MYVRASSSQVVVPSYSLSELLTTEDLDLDVSAIFEGYEEEHVGTGEPMLDSRRSA
jgi:hypothetical protein